MKGDAAMDYELRKVVTSPAEADERFDTARIGVARTSEATSGFCFSFKPGSFDSACRRAHAGYLPRESLIGLISEAPARLIEGTDGGRIRQFRL